VILLKRFGGIRRGLNNGRVDASLKSNLVESVTRLDIAHGALGLGNSRQEPWTFRQLIPVFSQALGVKPKDIPDQMQLSGKRKLAWLPIGGVNG